jgi:hypothetical protein
MTDNPTDWSWFTNLPLNDQVDLLAQPSRELSQALVDRVRNNPGITSWIWQGQQSSSQKLEPTAAMRLRDVRRQLDHWWNQLTPEQQTHIAEHRNTDLDIQFWHIVRRASHNPVTNGENADLAVMIADAQTGSQFRLPEMIRPYVEMVSV